MDHHGRSCTFIRNTEKRKVAARILLTPHMKRPVKLLLFLRLVCAVIWGFAAVGW